jgi:hypothetical protein
MSAEEISPKKKPTIEVLMEGPGGELYFQPIEADISRLEQLIANTKDSMVRHNLEEQLKKMRHLK